MKVVYYIIVLFIFVSCYKKNNCGEYIIDYLLTITDNSVEQIKKGVPYILIIVTPLDCECMKYILEKEFINKVKSFARNYELLYIVSGDYSINELKEYVEGISETVLVLLDNNNAVKTYLYDHFLCCRTPMLIITDRNGVIKFWNPVDVEKPLKFVKVLEVL